MRIELKTGALQLQRGQTLKVVDGAGSTVCARQGRRVDHRREPAARHRARAGQLLSPVEPGRGGHRGARRRLRFIRLKGSTMRYDFSYMQALQAKARRERSEAMYES